MCSAHLSGLFYIAIIKLFRNVLDEFEDNDIQELYTNEN